MSGVDDISPTDVWAIGSAEAEYYTVPQIAHWNGKAWRQITLPSFRVPGDPYPDQYEISAISGTSGTNAWAVGYAYYAGTTALLVLHWNGVETTSPSSAWAIGLRDNMLSWNGKKWPPVTIPWTEASGIAGISATDVWVVGNNEDSDTGIIYLTSQRV